MIYRLVTSRTFEQEMFDRASKKLGLDEDSLRKKIIDLNIDSSIIKDS